MDSPFTFFINVITMTHSFCLFFKYLRLWYLYTNSIKAKITNSCSFLTWRHFDAIILKDWFYIFYCPIKINSMTISVPLQIDYRTYNVDIYTNWKSKIFTNINQFDDSKDFFKCWIWSFTPFSCICRIWVIHTYFSSYLINIWQSGPAH